MARITRMLLACSIALVLVGCPEDVTPGQPDGTVSQCGTGKTRCGSICCNDATEVCNAGVCDLKRIECDTACDGETPVCDNGICKCNDTSCPDGSNCNESGACVPDVCEPETKEAFCARMKDEGKVCGEIGALDICGALKSFDCGDEACTGETPRCDSSTNTCVSVCNPETEAQFCTRMAGQGKICGMITARNNCGTGDTTANCGTNACTGGRQCDSANTCACPTDKTFEGGACISTKQVDCAYSGIAPANAHWDVVSVTITYTTASGWSSPAACDWMCDGGYEKSGGQCVPSVTCTEATCNGHGECAMTGTPPVPTCTCNTGYAPPNCGSCAANYIDEDGACINSKQVPCSGTVPENATVTNPQVTITYTTAGDWTSAAACVWSCNTNYAEEGGACINSKQVPCSGTVPENATATNPMVTVTYTTAGSWTSAAACDWACDTNWAKEGGGCINSKQVNCATTGSAPANAEWEVVPVTITYTTAGGWSAEAACDWACNSDWAKEGGACINSKQVNCATTGSMPANAEWEVVSVTITYTTAGGWSAPAACTWSCNSGYDKVGDSCVPACTPETNTAFCTRMSGLGKKCGLITAPDAICGTTMTVDCGKSACTGTTTLCDGVTNTCIGTSTAPSNNLCAGAFALTLGVPVSGDTTSAAASYGGTLSSVCTTATDGINGAGPDLAYSYTPAADGAFYVLLSPASAYDPLLWMTVDDCGGAGSACMAASDHATYGGGWPERLRVDGIAGITYYFYPDSYSNSASSRRGAFTIEVFPAEDSNCDPLDPMSCGTNQGCYWIAKKAGHFCAPVTGTPAGGPCTGVAGECGNGGTCMVPGVCRAYCDLASPLTCKAGDTCTAVSGGGGGCIPSAPANDVCGTNGASAIALTLGVEVSGNTLDAKVNYPTSGNLSTACNSAMGYTGNAAGPELVYSYTPSANGVFYVTVTPSVTYDPLLWMSTTCGGAGSTCANASDNDGYGVLELLTVNGVAGTKYYFYVDSFHAQVAGTFTIQVTTCATEEDYGTVTLLDSFGESYSNGSALGAFLLTSDGDMVQLELYPGSGAFSGGLATGTFTISGADLNYGTCGLCVLLLGNGGVPHFITGGTVQITSVTGNLTGTLMNATFEQVTIDSSYISAPVPGGCQSAIASMPFDTVLEPQ